MGLAAQGLCWRYGRGPWLLSDLTVDVPDGSLLRVIGGNGSGKSTLLALLAGVAVPQRGSVVSSEYVGYLPQLARQLPAVPSGRLLHALTGRAGAADPVLVTHGAVDADRLSGGTARRLMLEAVLAFPTRVLVLDEPAAGLDATAVVRLATTLRQRCESGFAVVIADHGELAESLPATEVLDLGGLAPQRSGTRIVLRGEGSLRGQAASYGVLEMVVADADELLREALNAGWSVVAVERVV